jgi:hypothetical protein
MPITIFTQPYMTWDFSGDEDLFMVAPGVMIGGYRRSGTLALKMEFMCSS